PAERYRAAVLQLTQAGLPMSLCATLAELRVLDNALDILECASTSRRAVGEVIINVKTDGSIVMNRKTLSSDELGATLRKIAELYPDQAVILRGDEGADYRHIVAVLDVCRGANIWNVAFATGRPES
ncbi:MAG: biopolymer transporter ExbD, partial [Chthoniobacterales bacterium]